MSFYVITASLKMCVQKQYTKYRELKRKMDSKATINSDNNRMQKKFALKGNVKT